MVVFSKLPVMMSDEDVVDKRYEEGKIYLVKCKYDDELVYVGSTFRTLEDRFSSHKGDKKCSLYQYVDGDWDNWYIELYEDYPCKNKYHLERREGDVQREIATINKNIAGRTTKEYNYENREKRLEQAKKHYQDNREKRLEQAKQYHHDNYENIKEKKKEYYQNNNEKLSEYHKQYRKDNREKRLEQIKKHYQDNREKRLEKNKEKIPCDHCGSIVNRNHIARHKKSLTCMNFKNCV